MKSKIFLKGLMDYAGRSDEKEIHTLDEVRTSGSYLVVARNVTAGCGFPQIEGEEKGCYCCEGILEVACCYTDDESQSNSTYCQKLTICDRETGSAGSYIRVITPKKNDGEWGLWQMVATGAPELVAGNNEIIEAFSNLDAKTTTNLYEMQLAQHSILSVVQMVGKGQTGVYEKVNGLIHGHTYRIYLPQVWAITSIGDGAIVFELYYKDADENNKVIKYEKTSDVLNNFYEITWPEYIPSSSGLTIYARADVGEIVTAVVEDVTAEMKSHPTEVVQYFKNIIGENIELCSSVYIHDGTRMELASHRSALVEVKKGDVFYFNCETLKDGQGQEIKPFVLFDTDMAQVTYFNPGKYDNGLFQVYVDGYVQLCASIYSAYKFCKVDKQYLSLCSDLDVTPSVRLVNGEFVRFADGLNAVSTVNSRTGWVPTMGFSRVEITVNSVESGTVSTGIAFYDADRNYISGIMSPHYGGTGDYVREVKDVVYDIPANAAFLRSTIFTEFTDRLKVNFSRVAKGESPAVYYDSLNWKVGYPYYNTGEITSNSSVNKYCEIDVDGADYPVIETVVTKTALGVSPGIVFYDENDEYIIGYQYPNYGVSDTSSVTLTAEVRRYRIPRNTKKIRLACRNSISSEFYYKLYNEAESHYESITELKEIARNRRRNMLVGSPELYISPAVSDVYSSLNGKTTAQLYAEWDAMVEQFPEFITRGEDLGEVTKGSATYQLRQYTVGYNRQWLIDHEPAKDEIVTQTATNYWQAKDNARKILIPIGMHGEEKTACWGAMLAIKELLESNEDWALFIKSNFILKIVPTLNPSGFNDCVRAASDGNVMNRETSVETPETLMYYDWVSKNTDAFILMDFHGTQGRYAYLPCWDGSPVFDLVKRATVQLSALLYENYKEFYNSACDGYGTTYAPFFIAKYSKEVSYYSCSYRIWEDYGIPTFALETPANLVVPNSDGSVNENLSGLIGENDLRNCKIAKDLLINCIQAFGCADSIGDYRAK